MEEDDDDELLVGQLLKKFATFCGTQRFIAAFTTADHRSLMLSHSNPVHTFPQ
jgi:hypothetical protein